MLKNILDNINLNGKMSLKEVFSLLERTSFLEKYLKEG
jgi:hypothetical protein